MVTRIAAALATAAMLVLGTVTPAAAAGQPVFSYQTQAGATHQITNPVAGKCYRLDVQGHGDLVLRVRNATDLDAVVSATADCSLSGDVHVVAHGHLEAKIALAASVRFRQA